MCVNSYEGNSDEESATPGLPVGSSTLSALGGLWVGEIGGGESTLQSEDHFREPGTQNASRLGPLDDLALPFCYTPPEERRCI